MRFKLLHSILFLAVLNIGTVSSQWPDSFECDSANTYFIFDCIPMIGGLPMQNGDTIRLYPNADELAADYSLVYLSDSLNILTIPSLGYSKSDSAVGEIQFRVYSQYYGCYSDRINYTNEDDLFACTQVISSFHAEFHYFEYSTSSLCQSDYTLYPVTDIPYADFSFWTVPDGLSVGELGEIYGIDSKVGSYILSVKTEFCLLTDTFEIEILEPPRLSLVDTLKVCGETSILDLGQEFDNLEISVDALPVSDTLSMDYLITESDYYFFRDNEQPCPAIDSIFIELVDAPEFDYEIKESCDSAWVEVNLANPGDSYFFNDEVSMSESDAVFYANSNTELTMTVVSNENCEVSVPLYIDFRKLEFEAADISIVDATCWQDGELILENPQVQNNLGNISYRLENTITKQIIDRFEQVPEGIYKVKAVEIRNTDEECEAELSTHETITILQECKNDYPVFTPAGARETEYFIPHTGTIKIYDRHGYLVRMLDTPAYWDGRDESGVLLPMGNYLMITDTDRHVNITIIK